MIPIDRRPMTCDDAAVALLLGDSADSVARAERHQMSCDRCSVMPRGSDDVPSRLQAALPQPPGFLLVLLALLGISQVIVAVPWLVGSDPLELLGSAVPATHATRDGALGVVIAVAALMAVARPRWARPSFYIASAALVAQGIAGVIDSSIVDTGASELVHLLSVVLTSVIGLCAISQVVRSLGPLRRSPLRGAPGDD